MCTVTMPKGAGIELEKMGDAMRTSDGGMAPRPWQGAFLMSLAIAMVLLVVFLEGCAENETKKCEYIQGHGGSQNPREEKMCYLNYAVTFRDITGCDRIRAVDQNENNFTMGNDCYAYFAKQQLDEALCDKIVESREGVRKMDCLKEVNAARIMSGSLK